VIVSSARSSIYGANTDQRLAALKRRYKANPAVMRRLSELEESAE